MKRKEFLLLFLSVIQIGVFAQKTEDDNNLYWQSDRKINFSDYQSKSDTNCIKYNEKYGLKMSSSIGFRWVVDVPKRWSGKMDKAYIAPVFCKNCSCILSEDSMALKTDRLLFDITEILSRNIRKELDEFQRATNVDNVNEMFFTTIKNKWDELRGDFFATVIREILIEKQEGAYEKWRKKVDEILEERKEYATKPEDCFRFISVKPIEKGYKKAKSIMGDMRSKNSNDTETTE